VNNAGVSAGSADRRRDFEAAWATTLAVNLTAHALRARLPGRSETSRPGSDREHRVDRGPGATAFISPYTASKHGVIGSPRLAVELGPPA
jgi:NAD(P)-dependent dehydrogenase (short-subunit alcohol dehydrogenase family)